MRLLKFTLTYFCDGCRNTNTINAEGNNTLKDGNQYYIKANCNQCQKAVKLQVIKIGNNNE